MTKKILFVFFSSLLIAYLAGFAFIEKNINKEKVPDKINTYLSQKYKNAKKIKYYIESDKDSTWYEVELIHGKEKISITFWEDGTLYEVKKL